MSGHARGASIPRTWPMRQVGFFGGPMAAILKQSAAVMDARLKDGSCRVGARMLPPGGKLVRP